MATSRSPDEIRISGPASRGSPPIGFSRLRNWVIRGCPALLRREGPSHSSDGARRVVCSIEALHRKEAGSIAKLAGADALRGRLAKSAMSPGPRPLIATCREHIGCGADDERGSAPDSVGLTVGHEIAWICAPSIRRAFLEAL